MIEGEQHEEKKRLIRRVREVIEDPLFKVTHRTHDKAFTRQRTLTFSRLLLLMLCKSVKSLQLILNEVSVLLSFVQPVSNAAYCKARQRLKASAFEELNRQAVVQTLYEDDDYRTWKGFRLLANDGSLVRLPMSPSIVEAFGTVPYKVTSGQTAGSTGQYAYARASVVYDVLNRIALDARFDPKSAYEVAQTIQQMGAIVPLNDLWLHDRGYASFELMAHHTQRQQQFVIRCSKGGFKTAKQMLAGHGADSQVVTLKAPNSKSASLKRQGLPTRVTVRFVRVVLENGELEVLVTSLLDEDRYPTAEFKTLYGLRWGVETFYSLLKTRLELEHFTGFTAESVRQDFHSSVFLTGLESLLTADAQAQLKSKDVKHPQQVNRMVSFHAIKSHAFELFASDVPIEQVVERLTALFLRNPTCSRPQRRPARRKVPQRQIIDHLRRRRKHCF